jgi:hypothetical protein
MMQDFIWTFALHAALVSLFAAGLHYGLRRPVNATWLALGLGAMFLYFLVVTAALGLQKNIPFMAELSFNWSGKVIAICLTLAMMKAVPRATRA